MLRTALVFALSWCCLNVAAWAAKYLASTKPRLWVRVIEAAAVPCASCHGPKLMGLIDADEMLQIAACLASQALR
jgi:hypothetical protein